MGEAGGTEQLLWRHPKARFFGAPPRFFAQEQRNGVELAAGGRDFYPRKRRTRTSPLPQVGRGTYSPPTCSAHANGGDTEVKKALFFGGSTPFLWASTKEMGSKGRTSQKPPPNVSAHTYKAKTRRHLICALYVCAVLLGNRPRWSCPFHPISLLLRKETGWSPKETRFWVPPREVLGPARLSHGLEAPTSQPTASS